MKLIKISLLFLLSFESSAQGISMPAGMGWLYLIFFITFVVCAGMLFFILRFIYKRIKHQRLFLIVVTMLILLIVGVATNRISLTSTHITDNNPLENPIKIVVQKDLFYFELEDGRAFEFTDKYHSSSKKESIQEGRFIELGKANNNGELTVYSIGNSSSFYHHKMFTADVWFTVPIFRHNIDKSTKKYEGEFRQLQADWIADERHLIRALTKGDCCDINWIEELIVRGANENQVINKQLLFHRFYSFAATRNYIQYRKSLVWALKQAQGADINSKGLFGKTILHLTVDKIPGYNKAELTQADKEYIQYLIDAGVNPNSVDEKGKIPLHYALMKKNFPLSELLIELGSDINLKDSRGESPYNIITEFYSGDGGNRQYSNMSEQDKKIVRNLLEKIKETRNNDL